MRSRIPRGTERGCAPVELVDSSLHREVPAALGVLVPEAAFTPAPQEDDPPVTPSGAVRALGLGLIAGAADDDPSAIGTYASAGAKLGPAFLWIAPAVLPMMAVVVYLSAKLGQVSGRGLFHVIRARYMPPLVYTVLIGVVIGNVIEAAADLGGMAAALHLLVPVPIRLIVVVTGIGIVLLQVFASYVAIRNVFRWLTLALLAYVASAILAKPDLAAVLRGTFVPRIEFTATFLTLVVAVLGTSLSAYLFTWQSNAEVEEEIAHGRSTLTARKGATHSELNETRRDVVLGMAFSSLIMYFVMLATGSTLHRTGPRDIETAAQAATALRPLAGSAASALFAIGIVGVGVLAVPVMTAGAAYDLVQAFGGRTSLHARPREAKGFYLTIALLTAAAIGLNFFGFNPMKALVWAGLVQGFSTPVLLVLLMQVTNDRTFMGENVNGRVANVLGWLTTGVVSAATIALLVTWLNH
jgi:Mn2+/Fe2+ NRAMP family transporter